MDKKRRKILKYLRRESFRSSHSETFPLSSGIKSKYYIDCKASLAFPEVRELVGDLIFEIVQGMQFDAVGGLFIGAYPMAMAVSDAYYRRGNAGIRAFVIRKEAKSHGLLKLIEGGVREASRVLIVDDVVTSGSSTVEAITKCRDEGLEVVRAIALVDRQEEHGGENIRKQAVEFDALFTLADLIEFNESDQDD